MNDLFKKFMAVVCAMVMVLSTVTVFAEEETEEEIPLYEKYGYSEKFEYEDEIIAHALKSTVPLIYMEFNGTIEYTPITFDRDYFWYVFEEMQAQYDETEINDAMLTYMEENLSDFLMYGREKTVNCPSGGTGSGVVISDDGYIATNSHVVTMNEDSKKEMYSYMLQSGVWEDLEAIMTEVSEYGFELTSEAIDELYWMVSEYSSESLTVLEEESTLYAYFPSSDGDTDIEHALVYEAEVVNEGTQYGVDGYTQDTAIIKIDKDNMVSLNVSERYPELNSQVVSAGFPAADNEIFELIGSEASTLSVTVGTGKVTRLVEIDGTKYQAIGTNNIISPGNSGGPSVDQNLNVEGLNTYGNAYDNRYVYMVPAEFVRELAKNVDMDKTESTKVFMTGLQLLQNGYGPAALECFEYVEELQPDTPYITNLIVLAEEAPQNEYPIEKEEPKKKTDNTMIFIIAGAAALALIIIILVIVIVKKKKKKKAAAPVPTAPSAPTPATPTARPGTPITQAPPARPAAPVTQVPPVRPAAPVTQAPPARPAAPVTQVPPVRPAAPVTQVPPVRPAAPVTQVPPVRPAAPVTQVPPANPGVPVGGKTISTMPSSPATSAEKKNDGPSTPTGFERASDLD